MDPLRLYSLLGVAVAGASLAGYWLRSKRKTPEQLERERRLRIYQTGRITDGAVLDAQEQPVNGHPAQLVMYTYDVGGVTYEASQDVTHLRHLIDLHTCRIGVQTSVRYDPHNHGDSIVIVEEWNGLRK